MSSSVVPKVAVVGAGFAGSEAAWQLARRGIAVDLFEMRPTRMTEAHQSGNFAEPVCSNSFKSVRHENAHGLLKAELEVQGSVILEAAKVSSVPAGQALAVDRMIFSAEVTKRMEDCPGVNLIREEVVSISPLLETYDRVILATGPLTSEALATSLGQLTGQDYLYFHDAIAPVVEASSINEEIAFRASRYGKGDDDYLNCPLNEAEYHAFIGAVRQAETVAFHQFESLRPFEGCLPIEVMVARGELTLAFGPMKPVGLPDPRTGKQPFAVVQLRQENKQATLYGLVGFQTKMTWPEQRRIFRMIPGLEQAEFARMGSLHRNTFLNAPSLLSHDLALKTEPRLHFAGQITGVEGYMESTAMGMYVAKRVASALLQKDLPIPSSVTMTGGLVRYLMETPPASFQPMNSAFGLVDSPTQGVRKKDRKAYYANRALEEMRRLEQLDWGSSSQVENTIPEEVKDRLPE